MRKSWLEEDGSLSRNAYIACFMVLAFTFVPVFLFFVIGWSVTPCSYQIYFIFSHIKWFGPALVLAMVRIGYVAAYGSLFYFGATASYHILSKVQKPSVRRLMQIVFLLGLFSFSFLKVIHKETFYGSSETYCFWGACEKFVTGP